MARSRPAPRAEIRVSAEIHGQLINAAARTIFEKETWEIAAEAIDESTRRHNPDALPGPASAGYQWKALFLPEHDGKPISPSDFVNALGGLRRNPWNCAWILFPQSKDWKLART